MHADAPSSFTALSLSQRYRHRGWGAALLCHLIGVGVFIWLASHPGAVLQVDHSGGRTAPVRGHLLTSDELTAMMTRAAVVRGPEQMKPAEEPVALAMSRPGTAADLITPRQDHERVKPLERAPSSRRPVHHTAVSTSTPSSRHTVPPVPRGESAKTVSSPQHDVPEAPAQPVAATVVTSRQSAASIGAPAPSAAQTTENSPAPASSRPADLDAAGGPVIHTARYLGSPPHKEYPPLARRRGWQGTVLIEIWLDAQGDQLKREVIRSSGYAELDRAALRLVAASAFAPYKFNGVGHAARLHLPVAFNLNDPS